MRSLFVVVFFLFFSFVALAQQPPPPVAKPTPAEKTELTEAEFDAKLAATLQKPMRWKQYSFPGFAISVGLPREPVRQTESFYDEAVGNSRMVMHVAMSDNAVFFAGNLAMPYSVTDDKVLRDMYAEVIKEFAADPDFQFGDPKDFYFDGRLGLELSAKSAKRTVAGRSRVFVVGRNIYLMIALPMELGEGESISKAVETQITAEIDRFFKSALVAKTVQPTVNEPPTLAGSFANGIYRSSYFRFSLTVPEKWLKASAEDVAGLRKWGKDFLSANTDTSLPEIKKNGQNLATFVSLPLGNERIASISINLGIPATKAEDDMKMAELTESLLRQVAAYEVVKK